MTDPVTVSPLRQRMIEDMTTRRDVAGARHMSQPQVAAVLDCDRTLSGNGWNKDASPSIARPAGAGLSTSRMSSVCSSVARRTQRRSVGEIPDLLRTQSKPVAEGVVQVGFHHLHRFGLRLVRREAED